MVVRLTYCRRSRGVPRWGRARPRERAGPHLLSFFDLSVLGGFSLPPFPGVCFPLWLRALGTRDTTRVVTRDMPAAPRM